MIEIPKFHEKGREPWYGPVVMGGDSCFEGCGFKSQHCTLNGHFSQTFVWKEENKLERGSGWPIKKELLGISWFKLI